MPKPVTPVIVLGTARTGTSLTAGLLQHLGVDMGGTDNFSTSCPYGSFEDRQFLDITTKLHLKELVDIQEVKNHIKERERLTQNKKQRYWGFKSALSHRLYDEFLQPYFNGKNPLYVVVFRNPYYAGKSWKAQMANEYGENVDTLPAIKQMLTDNLELVDMLQKVDYSRIYMTTFEDIRNQPVEVLRGLAGFLEIPLLAITQYAVRNMVLPHYDSTKEMYKRWGPGWD